MSVAAGPITSTRWIGRVVSTLLAAHVVLALVAVARFLSEIDLVQRIDRGGITQAEVDELDRQLRQVSTIGIGLLVVTALCWLVWEYLAYRNLRELGATGRLVSPWGSVGWWFVPFANFVKPFVCIRDLWKASGTEPTAGWPTVQTWGVIGWWWATFLASRFITNIGLSLRDDAETIGAVTQGDRVVIFGELVLATSAVLAILIVRSIVDRQDARSIAPAPVPPRPDEERPPV
jgi:hypothetical protein